MGRTTNKLISLSKASDMLNMSRQTLKKHCEAERLPYYKIGNKISLKTYDVKAYLETFRVSAKKEPLKNEKVLLEAKA